MNVIKCNQHNAIKVAAFAIEFNSQSSSSDYKALAEYLVSKDSDFFTSSNFLEGVSVQFSAENLAETVTNKSNIFGITLAGPNSWEMIFKDHTLVFQTTNYIGWEESLDFAQKSLDFFIGFIESQGLNKQVRSFGLEFLDEFIVPDPDSNWINDLFCSNSKYLPQYVYDQKGFWHTHFGFFQDGILTRANLDYITDDQNRFKQMISMQHRLAMPHDQPGMQLKVAAPSIITSYGLMHNMNMALIKDLFTHEVLKDIGVEER